MSEPETIRSWTSPDGRHRAYVERRTDGLYQFHEETFWEEILEDAGNQVICYWTPTDWSGVYQTLVDAEREACASLYWLRQMTLRSTDE